MVSFERREREERGESQRLKHWVWEMPLSAPRIFALSASLR